MSKYKQVGELNGETLYITSKDEVEVVKLTLEVMSVTFKEVGEVKESLANVQELLRDELLANEDLNADLSDTKLELESLEEDYLELCNTYSDLDAKVNTEWRVMKSIVTVSAISALVGLSLAMYVAFPNMMTFLA